jgi:hypothetical protein
MELIEACRVREREVSCHVNTSQLRREYRIGAWLKSKPCKYIKKGLGVNMVRSSGFRSILKPEENIN